MKSVETAIAPEPCVADPQKSKSMETQTGKILIVDDEPQVVSLIREELSEHGFVCWTAGEVDGAKALINSQSPDVMITDVLMSNIGGLELLAYAGTHAPRCKVILITGSSRREYIAQAMLLGAYDYIEKPFVPGELVEAASKAFEGGGNRPILLDRAAAALELDSQVRQASLDSVRALVRAVEAKDPYTRRHSEQVAHYAVNLALALGLSATMIKSIRVASLLHDIGKIGVPDHILAKPGPLTAEEFYCVRNHPVLGAEILANITLFSKESLWVRHHHERWDGKGYPDGLTGENCPLASRIMQVADSIDAMLMERTYRAAYSVEKMIGELVRCAGTQFDPRIATAAVTWCQAHREALFLPENAAPAIQEVA
ncbi:MAG: HD domain-containing phosphohydrolase [Phycisphaerae bacterium]|jgi:putative nucleotidyltransferase with HDIG domain